MKKSISLLFSLITLCSAHAEWTSALETSDITYFIDKDSKKTIENYNQINELINLKSKEKNNFQSMTGIYQYDCQSHKFRIIQLKSFSNHMANGEFSTAINKATPWVNIDKKTARNILFEIACQ